VISGFNKPKNSPIIPGLGFSGSQV
jgi:hypothetical protein